MKYRATYKLIPTLVAAFALLSACGSNNYQTASLSAEANAGNQVVVTNPKVDLVFFQDDSDSGVITAINQIRPQLNSFISSMNADVDARLVVMPLLTAQPAVAGRLVLAKDCSTVRVGNCTTNPAQFNAAGGGQGWLGAANANSSIGANDKGLATMRTNLNYLGNAGYFRSDASTAVIMLSNGNDMEGAYFTDDDGDGTASDEHYNYANFNQHIGAFRSFKNGQGFNFYPVVKLSAGCTGVYGTRYVDMVNSLNSFKQGSAYAFDLCGNQMNYVLQAIYAKVQTIVQQVVFNYAVVSTSSQPNTGVMEVRKNGVLIPQSSTNGWQYVGYLQDQPTSYSPASGNVRSGYMIKLNGSAEYRGTDKITVQFLAN